MKHLELIQGVINRLAGNSFSLKRWSVLILTAFVILLAREPHSHHHWFILVPLAALWLLDGYYLAQERLYRKLYDQVRKSEMGDMAFSLTPEASVDRRRWSKAIVSRTVWPLYGGFGAFALLLGSCGTQSG